MQRLVVRIADTEIAALVLLVGRIPIEKADRIGIPGCDVEIAAYREMVERDEAAHEVVRDRHAGRMRADNIGLEPVEGDDLVRRITLEVHHMRRVRFGHGEVRQADLLEGTVLHRPEDVAPCAVERVGRLVFLCQPVAEPFERRARIAFDRVVTTVFIVGLPGRERRMVAVALCQVGDDTGAFAAIALVAETVVAA